MSAQLDLLDLLVPPSETIAVYRPRQRRQVQTRAQGHPISIDEDDPEPFEVEVRGIPCVIAPGFCTHVIQPAGSPFWSETGFRSFGIPTDDPGAVVTAIERYIAAPAKHGNGCGGTLTRWWPDYILRWRQSLAFELECARDRSTMWAQWGPEKHAEHWTRHDAKQAAAVARMWAEGIDPNDVGPRSGFRGKWPRFEMPA